jgi:RNA recognition motif-containing protein
MGTRLYVGNLPATANESGVRALFEQNERKVSEVKFINDRETGQPRGFAFVEMGSPDHAQQAISQLDGVEFDGNQLKVNEARERVGGGRRVGF